MSGPSERDEIAALLSSHGLQRSWNGIEGHTPAKCGCGAVLSRGTFSSGVMEEAAHRAHLTDLLAERDRRTAAKAWFAGYDKGNLDGYFGTNDERAKSPYADLDPCREQTQ